jgi:hypothetical protein
VVFVRGTQVVLEVPGSAVDLDPQGHLAVVLDLTAHLVRVVDLGSLQERLTVPLALGMDPLNPPVVTVSPDGTRALVMDARDERGDASLEDINLRTGEVTRLLGPLPAPSWVAATALPEGRTLVTTMQAGENPVARLMVLAPPAAPRVLVELPVSQPCTAPLAVGSRVAVALLSLQAHPMATYGPTDVCMLYLDGGVPTPVTRHGALHGRLRVRAGGVVVVEGGAALGVLTPVAAE